MFPGNRRLCSKSGGRIRVECGDDRSNEGMESAVVPPKTISSLPNAWDSGEGTFTRTLLLWGKRLLPGRFPSMATVPRSISNDKETGSAGWTCPALRLCLGRVAKSQPRCVAGVNALSSARTDEQIEAYFSQPPTIQED